MLVFSCNASAKFQETSGATSHQLFDVGYKLLPRFRGLGTVVAGSSPSPLQRLVPARVLDVPRQYPQTRSMNRFDIQVEGNRNYFVGGVMVHNSPETTNGRKGTKFYASVSVGRQAHENALKDGTDASVTAPGVKVVKNKGQPAIQAGRVRHPVWQGHLQERVR